MTFCVIYLITGIVLTIAAYQIDVQKRPDTYAPENRGTAIASLVIFAIGWGLILPFVGYLMYKAKTAK